MLFWRFSIHVLLFLRRHEVSILTFNYSNIVLLLGGLTTTHCLVPSLHHQLIYHTLFSCEYSLLVLLFRDMCPVLAMW